jgi:hypothetical protein
MRVISSWTMVLATGAAIAGCSEPQSITAPFEGSEAWSDAYAASALAPFFGIGPVIRSYPSGGCDAAEHRQFDFWLGAWRVDPARSHISSRLDGCVVHERFAGPAGFGGQSLNAYDADTDSWYQYWASDFGFPLVLEGGLDGDRMIMSGDLDLGGYIWTDRIVWTPQDGKVRQVWDRGTDHGATFPTTVFDGLYTAAPDLDPFPFRNPGVCTGGNFETMSFLVGTWSVRAENGLELGTSEVGRSTSGCLIEERFTNGKGYESLTWMFSYYGQFGVTEWKRVTVDNQGESLRLAGAPAGTEVLYAGSESGPEGQGVEVQVRVSPLGPDEVRVSFQVGPGNRPPFEVIYRRQ